MSLNSRCWVQGRMTQVICERTPDRAARLKTHRPTPDSLWSGVMSALWPFTLVTHHRSIGLFFLNYTSQSHRPVSWWFCSCWKPCYASRRPQRASPAEGCLKRRRTSSANVLSNRLQRQNLVILGAHLWLLLRFNADWKQPIVYRAYTAYDDSYKEQLYANFWPVQFFLL